MRDSGQPKSRFAELLRKIGASFLKLFRGDFLVFLLFLGITFFFWWSQTMKQNYDTVMKVPVHLTGITDDIRVISPSVSQVSVSLSGKGGALRKSGRIGGRHVLMIDGGSFIMNQGHASLSTQSLKDSISALIPSSVIVHSVEPDSLTYQYARQRTVMLPVEFDGNMESQDQFFMERIQFSPDSVQAKILLSDTLFHSILANAGTVTLSSDTIVQTVALKPVPGVLLSTDNVRMTIIAQQYTEKSIEVPVLGVNFPERLTLKSFPSKAVVTVWVNRVGPQDFQVVVDYNDIAGRDVSKAPLHIYSQPANVRNVRLQTRTVDFLMESTFF